jgi:uncharacterized protein (DUF924 family)
MTPETVLEFWIGALDANGIADAEHTRRWWTHDAAFDTQVSTRFGALHEAVARGEHEAWLASPRGLLAYVIVLDQFSRNMFRGSARTFAHDAQALRAALQGIARGDDRVLACDERTFLYMPLMHCEAVAHQDRCVDLFAALARSVAPAARERYVNYLEFAQRHRDIVNRFGRFPHRNAQLGRDSTADELAFLQEPGSSF